MSILGDSGGGSSSHLAYGLLLFATVTMVALSLFIPVFLPNHSMDDNKTIQELEAQYYDFTNSVPTSEAVWGLKGVFTAYGYTFDGNGNEIPSSNWGYTEDGWLYGSRIINYTPSQYSNNATAYACKYNADTGLYYYTGNSTTINQHSQGDLYGSVVMDVNKKSNIFFTNSGKVQDGDFYYYKFNGLRYAFAPISAVKTIDSNGDPVDISPEQSTLSLIWYDWYDSGTGTSSGISGQLIVSAGTGSSNDYGVAYLTSAEIVSAFNSDTSTSRFDLKFNGISVTLHIRLDPRMLSSGLTVEQCFNQGYWSVMVSSKSADVGSVANASYSFDPMNVFDTMIDLLTFKTSDYGLTGLAGLLASFIIVIPLAIGLLTVGLDNYKVIILAGIWAVITAWNWGGF